MSRHPNVILVLALTPNDASIKSARDICCEAGIKIDGDEAYIGIGKDSYTVSIADDDYDEDFQITQIAGDIIITKMVTSGYGDIVYWDDLTTRKRALEEWAHGVCAEHPCTYRIYLTANYW